MNKDSTLNQPSTRLQSDDGLGPTSDIGSRLRALYGLCRKRVFQTSCSISLKSSTMQNALKASVLSSVENRGMATETTSFKREMLSTLPSLRAFAVSLTGKHDKADDLVQDTVMKAWAKQSSFEMGTNIKAWLFTILRNEFYSQMRKRGREVQDTDGAFTERLSVHPAQYGSMDMQDFKKALSQLPDDQREAVILIGASGFSYEEAAEICDCAVGTMKSRVSRARTRLQDILKITGESNYGADAVSAQVTTSNHTF